MKLLNKRDLIIVLALLAFLLAVYFYKSSHRNGNFATLYYKGEAVKAFELVGEPLVFEVAQNSEVQLAISADGIEFIASNCPDKICVHTGQISRYGQSAACLPNSLVIKIESNAAFLDGAT